MAGQNSNTSKHKTKKLVSSCIISHVLSAQDTNLSTSVLMKVFNGNASVITGQTCK